MECLSTQGLPKTGRAAAWGALYATRMSHVEFTPGDHGNFDAELRIGQFGPIKLARLTLDNCSVERKRNHIVRNSPRLYNFLLQAEGSSTFYHCGKEARLETGDFVLCDTGLPHYWRTDACSVTVMVRVPGDILRTYLPTPEQYCGRHLGRATGLTGAVATMVRELSEGSGGEILPVYEDRVARYLLEMISMSYAMAMEPEQDASAIAWQRRKDVIEFIEDNLRDPELSPATISEAEAECSFTSTTIGRSYEAGSADARRWVTPRARWKTMSPCSRNSSAMRMACVSSPPELSRRSRISEVAPAAISSSRCSTICSCRRWLPKELRFK